MDTKGMVALLNFREDGLTPYMVFFKDGLIAEKCVSTLGESSNAQQNVSCNKPVMSVNGV